MMTDINKINDDVLETLDIYQKFTPENKKIFFEITQIAQKKEIPGTSTENTPE